jgi:hypothetical protein
MPENVLLSSNSESKILYERHEKPFGITWEEWSIRWWKWVLSIPIEKNPGMSSYEGKFSAHQPYPEATFLIGSFEGHTERSYCIPKDRAIFFPVVNFITSFVEEPELKTDYDLIRRANEDIESLVNVRVNIDGIPLRNFRKYRVQSPVFTIKYRKRNVFGFPASSTRAISDGFWVFLKGLESGKHQIHVFGSCYLGSTKESTTWQLELV